MKKIFWTTLALFLSFGVFAGVYSPLLIKVEKDNFSGGVLEISGEEFRTSAGSGIEYHVVFVDRETEVYVSCESNGVKTKSSGGYLTPRLQWYISISLSNCAVEDFKSIF